MRWQGSAYLLAAALFLLGAGPDARAGSTSDAESLVHEIYFEALPYDRARSLDSEAVDRLTEMLADSAESPHHSNIVLALGMSGHPDAFAALSAFANTMVVGEVDRETFRARTHITLAMGHLARDDSRALQWLLEAQSRTARETGWHFRHHRGVRLARILEEQTLMGLALSGAPEAGAVLDRAAAAATGGDVSAQRRRRQALHVRELHRRIAVEGAAAVMSSPGNAATHR